MVLDYLADKLKACKNVEHFNVMRLTDLCRKLCRNKRLYSVRHRRHCVGFLVCSDYIIKQKRAHLVSRNGAEISVSGFSHNSNAVCIGVCSDNKAAANLVCNLNTACEYFLVFGIGFFNGGEVTVNYKLLIYLVKMLKSDSCKDLGDKLVTCAVERGVYYFKIVCNSLYSVGVNKLLFNA